MTARPSRPYKSRPRTFTLNIPGADANIARMSNKDTALQKIRDLLGDAGVVEEASHLHAYNTEWRGHFTGHATFVARPKDAAECGAVVKICADAGIGVVPLGGNTGLVGGWRRRR